MYRVIIYIMPGGELQLVAYGAQDLYLTGNPQKTFFKRVYKRYTNFAMEYIRQDFTKIPSANTTESIKLDCKIGRNGDLIGDIYLVYDLPNIFSTDVDNFKWINDIGLHLVRSAEILIGGQSIDKQYGLWMKIWNELVPKNPSSYKRMIGKVTPVRNPYPYYGSIEQGVQSNDDPLPGQPVYPSIRERRLYVPLEFWFCRNSGLFLPLVALQYHEVHIVIEIEPLNHLFTVGKPSIAPCKLFGDSSNPGDEGVNNYDELLELLDDGWDSTNLFWRYVNGTESPGAWNENVYLEVNYIFLDDEERRRFAKSSHSYLITQVQQRIFCGLTGSRILELQLQHPVNELMWVFRRSDVDKTNQWSNFTNLINPGDILTIRTLRDCLNCLKLLDCDACPPDTDDYKKLRPLTLGSGLTVEELWTIINNDDANQTPLENIDAFDQNNNIMYTARFMLNGHDRMASKDTFFFEALQTYKYHGRSPINDPVSAGVYAFSFSLKPAKPRDPSGSINMSRINKVQMEIVLREPQDEDLNYDMFLYAVNHNILRIKSGMGSTVFAN